VLLLKKLHVRENETLPLKLQKEVQPQGEESALPPVVRERLPLRERHLRERLPLRERHLREKAALRERHLRERLPLRNEEGNQSFRLKNLFLFF
jgi:E3 ubiquitin-protein ligase DOA10